MAEVTGTPEAFDAARAVYGRLDAATRYDDDDTEELAVEERAFRARRIMDASRLSDDGLRERVDAARKAVGRIPDQVPSALIDDVLGIAYMALDVGARSGRAASEQVPIHLVRRLWSAAAMVAEVQEGLPG